MIDISFWEIAVIGVVALVVLGPERLPKVARTAGHLFGRMQRYVATVKADLNREMEMSELAKVKQEVQEAARAFEQSANEQASAIDAEARKVSQSLETAARNPPEPVVPETAPSQTDMLAEQDAAFNRSVDALPDTGSATPASPPPPRPLAPSNPSPVAQSQSAFDFGVEPVRRKAS